MKASVFHQHGGPEVLKYEDVPEPKPGPRDVVIQVKAAGCNYNDLWARQGLPDFKSTTRDVKRRIAEQLKTAAIKNYRIELDELAEREDEESERGR